MLILGHVGRDVDAYNEIGYNISEERIIGTDDRQLVSNTTDKVNRAIVRMSSQGYNRDGKWSSYNGTGVMISEDTVLTAGHVIYNLSRAEYLQNIEVTPAATWQNGRYHAPLILLLL